VPKKSAARREASPPTEVLADLREDGARLAAARSRAYRVIVEAFAYPEGEQLDSIRTGELARALEESLGAVDPGLVEGIDREALRDGGVEDGLAVEYTRLFDVGPSGPPCPLYGGLYGGARMKTMEEAVRFYNHFGLSLSSSPRELPDHLTTQLEFLHFLAFREAEALEAGRDAAPFRRAQRDFVERHPGRWLPKLRARLEKQHAPRFFVELALRLERLLGHAHSVLADTGDASRP
jgi:DMSO reductase family type II enzyme chaperone